MRATFKKWYEDNRDYYLEYADKNRERIKSYSHAWIRDNYIKYRENTNNWQKKNPERVKEISYNWRKTNKDKHCSAQAKRRSNEARATPNWLTDVQRQEISSFYTKSKELTRTTGIKHEVDHLVPIKGKEVNGLHVPWNLQILTASQNRKKHNKL